MTGWGVERTPRTAHRPSPVSPAGVSALMPPPSQGAERRKERHATRTGSRWGLRVLVIGGLAGAAWLLTGAAAHAADRDPAPEGSLLGSPLVGSVLHGGAARPMVSRVLQAAVRPLEPDHHVHEQHKIADRGSAPTLIVGTLTEVTNGMTHSTVGEVTRVVRDLTAPIRLTGGPSDSRQIAPVSAPVTKILRPATDLVPSAVGTTVAHEKPATHEKPAADEKSAADEKPATPEQPKGSGTKVAAGPTGTTVSQWRSGVTDRHHVTVEAAAPEAVRAAPAGDGPAPPQVYFGAVNGIPAPGSGAPTEGSSAAFSPVAVGEQAVASHRLPLAAGVEARHHDAEAPTASPD
jgi:hypothetical protein